MKKHVFLWIYIIINPFLTVYSQEYDHLVTSIEIKGFVANKVELRWKATVTNGNFSIYYHDKMISDVFVLRKATLVADTNLSTQTSDDFYTYTITLPKTGTFYFSVILNDTYGFDNIARNIFSERVKSEKELLIPELNTTLQPIIISEYKTVYNIPNNFKTTAPSFYGYLITSMDLQSHEDIFKIKWSVYPKNLSQYVFVVYRSRYPIIQYKSSIGLPEYARVTNQFYFEDRNIAFETPYYYAVVAESSSQWDQNINVFVQPAVLLRDSPPFYIKPTLKYVEKKEKIPVNYLEVSEEEIQKAVEQTLSNLQIKPVFQSNVSVPANTIGFRDIPYATNTFALENSWIPTLIREKASVKTGSLVDQQATLTENYAKAMLNNRKRSFQQQDDQEHILLTQEKKEYQGILQQINDLAQEINKFHSLEEKLLHTDRLSNNDFQDRLHAYYNKKDHIRIMQYTIQGNIKNVATSREEREKTFRSSIYKIQEQEQQQEHSLYSNYVLLLKKGYQQEIERAEKQLKQYQLSQASLDVSTKTKNIDLNTFRVKGEQYSIGDISSQDLDNGFLQKNITQLELLIKQEKQNLKAIEMRENFQTTPVKPLTLPKSTDPEDRVVKIKAYYQDVVVEKIPDLQEIPKENWIVVKEEWLSSNKETWLAKTNYWVEQNKKILLDDYQRLESKWMRPSSPVALQEGKKSIQRGDYAEALYLLTYVAKDPQALLLLGKSYYEVGAYREAFSVFVTALKMGIPESRFWLDITAEKILEREIREEN